MSNSNRSFMHSFPFYDSDQGLTYDVKVHNKVGDSSISFEQESMKNQEERNFKTSELSFVPINDPDESDHNLVEHAVRRSSRVPKLSAHLNDYEITLNCSTVKYHIQAVCVVNSIFPTNFVCLMSNLDKVSKPSYMKDALNDPKWKRAMDGEMNVLINTNTWELVNIPS